MKYFLSLLFILPMAVLNGQQVDGKYLKGLKPRAIGPAGMSGRVTSDLILVESKSLAINGHLNLI